MGLTSQAKEVPKKKGSTSILRKSIDKNGLDDGSPLQLLFHLQIQLHLWKKYHQHRTASVLHHSVTIFNVILWPIFIIKYGGGQSSFNSLLELCLFASDLQRGNWTWKNKDLFLPWLWKSNLKIPVICSTTTTWHCYVITIGIWWDALDIKWRKYIIVSCWQQKHPAYHSSMLKIPEAVLQLHSYSRTVLVE